MESELIPKRKDVYLTPCQVRKFWSSRSTGFKFCKFESVGLLKNQSEWSNGPGPQEQTGPPV
jgi:hypothetical protein